MRAAFVTGCLLLSTLLAVPSASATLHDADGDGLPDIAEEDVCGRAIVAEALNLFEPTTRCVGEDDLVVVPPDAAGAVAGAAEYLTAYVQMTFVAPAEASAAEVADDAGRLAGILLTPDGGTAGELQAEAGALPGTAADLAGDEAAFVGGVVDGDQDSVPDDLEPFLCSVENGVDPSDGTCTEDNYHLPA